MYSSIIKTLCECDERAQNISKHQIKDTQKSRFNVSMEKFFQLGLHRNEGTRVEDASVVGSKI